MGVSFLKHLDWRFATKNFDSERKVSDENINVILGAIKKAPTSLGLQPFHVHIVTNDDMKKMLKESGFNQSQFQDSSHLLVFSTRTDLNARVDELIEAKTGGDETKKAQLAAYINMVKGFVGRHDVQTGRAWADRQTYLGLGFALAACAELEIDSCPMEGFNSEDFDEKIGLPENLKSVVVLCIGYRKGDPQRGKFRFDDRDLFTFVD